MLVEATELLADTLTGSLEGAAEGDVVYLAHHERIPLLEDRRSRLGDKWWSWGPG